ncbi:hypothetical protein METHB2_390016 [Candidatus Methylobacter favarea]|uniref:Uncharacterized protein n=1 Tax=Candidatus Methylobacter favarea TaxID=2707345 RepID=A0A8S0XT37_9GAMM|nr:hypothetical protein [Candidatus Methylobacter favarea]CAA9891282.1 hypothetical protein METHB2_390016 [Candidatus Methylobacter favarea]
MSRHPTRVRKAGRGKSSTGKLLGDRDTISKELTRLLTVQDLKLMTALKNN